MKLQGPAFATYILYDMSQTLARKKSGRSANGMCTCDHRLSSIRVTTALTDTCIRTLEVHAVSSMISAASFR